MAREMLDQVAEFEDGRHGFIEMVAQDGGR
jgi:hypothetical protein